MLPFPGTPDASPATQIDFPAVAPSEIGSVTVSGSTSGLHEGGVTAQPGGAGTAFTPDRPFSPGEQVSVSAALRSPAAGTASGAPGASQLRFSFTVGKPVSAKARTASAIPGAKAASSAPPLTRSYISDTTVHSPVVSVSGQVPDPAQGDIFVDSYHTYRENGPVILDPQGNLIWMQSTGKLVAADFRVQSYAGRPVLTYWQGTLTSSGHGGGVGVILNQQYQQIATIKAGNGYTRDGIDLHELTLTSRGTAMVTIYAPTIRNLSSVGGPRKGMLLDSVIQEIDVLTGKVVWEWHAFGHIPLTDSHTKPAPGQPWDAFHLNSIQQLPNGNLLISVRNTWAAYEISKKNGRIVWQLGGKHSDFTMGRGTKFRWQHDAELHPGSILTVFDDGTAAVGGSLQSRALAIHVNNRRRRATIVHAFKHHPPLDTYFEGNTQLLPDGNVFVGWGAVPKGSASSFSEYTPDGNQAFTASFVWPVSSYRAYRFPWTGYPTWQPSIAARGTTSLHSLNVYASWNGATELAGWRVLGATTQAGPFSPVGSTVPRAGFETVIPVATKDAYLEVEALDAAGNPLPNGTSSPIRAPL